MSFKACLVILTLNAAVLIGYIFYVPKCVYSVTNDMRVTANLSQLSNALRQFEMMSGRLPSDKEGLDALVHQPPASVRWFQYMGKLTPDPWRHPYRYRLAPELPGGFDLHSLGRDGVESGDDIHLKQPRSPAAVPDP